MSGYLIVWGVCAACHLLISFNPELVPSLRVNGVREPLCRACAEKWNEIHNANVPIHPDAYEPGDA
ncbi:MAG: hypothetical protein ABW123_22855 [Cystobacter sp.]